MPEGVARRKQRVLVAGAGVNGAALAWLAAVEGHEVDLVALGGPRERAASPPCELVAGLGPPVGGLFEWLDAAGDALAAAAAREREGRLLLRQLLLRARRPVSYRRLPLAQRCPAAMSRSRVEELVSRLRSAGYPVELEERSGWRALIRRDAGLIRPRRLTFELLRAAREAGARLRLRAEALPPRAGYETVFWPDHRAMAREGGHPPPGLERRVVLKQCFFAGERPLTRVTLSSHGDVCLLPDPASPGQVRLVRVAEENAAGGLTFPRLPSSWAAYTGAAVWQTMVEAHFCRAGANVEECLCGLATAPVTTILGRASSAVRALSGRSRSSRRTTDRALG